MLRGACSPGQSHCRDQALLTMREKHAGVRAIHGLLPPQLLAQADAPDRAPQAEEVVHADYAKDVVAGLTSQELDMALQDRVVQETNDAKNRVEEYVYNMRDALSSRLAPYEHEDARAALSKELDGVEVLSCLACCPSALVRVSMRGHVGAANALCLCLRGLPCAVHRALLTLRHAHSTPCGVARSASAHHPPGMVVRRWRKLQQGCVRRETAGPAGVWCVCHHYVCLSRSASSCMSTLPR
jgi:hypothetical protein